MASSMGPLPPPTIATSPPSPPAAADSNSPTFPPLSHSATSPASDRPATTRVYRSMIDVAGAATKTKTKPENKEAASAALGRAAPCHDAIQGMIDSEANPPPDGAK